MSISPETDRHLARSCWHLVAHRSELLADRDYVRLSWVLGDLAVFNDKGSIVAFDNLCPHRGARIFREVGGNAPAVCAYHGWSYRGGRLRIPKPQSYHPCDLAAARLNEMSVAWCGNFLFVAVAPAEELEAQLGGTWPVLEGISRDIDRRRDVNAYAYECPWRVAVENALEPDHVQMVHPETLGQLQLTEARNAYSGRNSVLSAEIGNARTARMLRSMRRLFDIGHQREDYLAVHVFPFAFVTSTFGYSYALQNFMPARDPCRTHFSSRLLTSRLASQAASQATEAFFASVAEINRQVFAEDHEVCRHVNAEFALDDPARIFSATEDKVRHFRDSVLAAKRDAGF